MKRNSPLHKLPNVAQTITARTLVLSASLMLAACSYNDGAAPLAVDAEPAVTDHYAASAISAADWSTATTILEGQLDDDPMRLLNLAYVYRQTGKSDAARDLYEAVLSGVENPYASRPEGETPLRVKTIARIALASLD